MMPQISDVEFDEILQRNKTVSSSAISRAVQDASAGEWNDGCHVRDLQTCCHILRGRPELSSFSHSTLGRGGQWPPFAFLNVDYDTLHFHTGSLKITIFKVLFWEEGRGSQKRVLCVRF